MQLTPRHPGLTLVELLVTIAISAIFASIAVPSLRGLLAHDRTSSVSNELLASIQQTRSEAVRFSRPASLCPRDPSNSNGCGGSWNNGWVVRIDQNGDNALDTTVRVRDGLPSGITITSTLVGSPPTLQFLALGQANAAASFTVTHSNPTVTRLVCVYPGGQSLVKATGGC